MDNRDGGVNHSISGGYPAALSQFFTDTKLARDLTVRYTRRGTARLYVCSKGMKPIRPSKGRYRPEKGFAPLSAASLSHDGTDSPNNFVLLETSVHNRIDVELRARMKNMDGRDR